MYSESVRAELAAELADAFLAGEWSAEPIAESGAGRLDRWPPWMTALALRVTAAFRDAPVRHRWALQEVIAGFLGEYRSGSERLEPPRILRSLPRTAARSWDHGWSTARIDSVAALAETLELSTGQLAWLADVRGLERTTADERLRNYRYRFLPRAGGPPRMIEAPKARLKEIQRWVLHEILDSIPPHSAAYGFVRSRPVVAHASLHAGQSAVLRLDLRDFFASVAAARVYGIFRTAGYAPSVAHTLTGLTTNVIPLTVWSQFPPADHARDVNVRFWIGRQLATPHLPQGAPSSPALANLAAFRLDRRLAGLAASQGLRYSRYADDLTFSGRLRPGKQAAAMEELVAAIAGEEGFAINRGKTMFRTAASRQSVCGIVVNVRPNVVRGEYDRLRAILHNVARHGPVSQNRAGVHDFRAHLRGRVAWVASLSAGRGETLWQMFDAIDWDRAPDLDP